MKMLIELQRMSEKEGFFPWLLLSGGVTVGIFIVIAVVLKIYYLKIDKNRDKKTSNEIAHDAVYEPDYFCNSVMEIVVCNTCILGVLCIYEALAPIINLEIVKDFSSLILLILILLAMGINRIIDAVWLDKEWCSSPKYSKSTLRLASSITVTIMWIVLSIIFKSPQYVSAMVIMTGLVLGRFIFFDSSFDSIKGELLRMIKYWKSMLLAIILVALLVGTGIHYEIIQEENVVVTLFFAHCVYIIATKTIKEVVQDLGIY